MIRITIYAGTSAADERPASTTCRMVAAHDVNEELRRIGLEWRTADYFPSRQVVITLDPVAPHDRAAEVKEKVRAAAIALEQTGLL